MDHHIKNVGSKPVPMTNALPGGTKSGKAAVVVQEDQFPDVAKPLEHLNLQNRVRMLAPHGEDLTRFVRSREAYFHGNQDDILENIRLQDPALAGTIDQLFEIAKSTNSDPAWILLTMLRNSHVSRQKANLADMLISIDEGAFISDYLMPVLEQRPGYDDENVIFCVDLLSNLSEDDLYALFSQVDFSAINTPEKVGQTLSNIPNNRDVLKRDLVLNTLLDIALDQKDDVYSEDKIQKQKKIQWIVLYAINKSPVPQEFLDSDPLVKLYQTGVDEKIYNGAFLTLKAQRGPLAAPIFLEKALEEYDPNDEVEKSKHYYAMDHYVGAKQDDASEGLEKFILTSKEPLLVYNACYLLAHTCNAKGKQTLINIIRKQVTDGEPSIPLVFLSSMINDDLLYSGLLKIIFSIPYPEVSSLAEAYNKTLDIKRLKIVQEDGKGYFHADVDPDPKLLVNVLNAIGIKELVKWTAPLLDPKLEEPKRKVVEALRLNLKSLFQQALKDDPKHMNSLILGGIALENDPPIRKFLLDMGLIRYVGKDSYL